MTVLMCECWKGGARELIATLYFNKKKYENTVVCFEIFKLNLNVLY